MPPPIREAHYPCDAISTYNTQVGLLVARRWAGPASCAAAGGQLGSGCTLRRPGCTLRRPACTPRTHPAPAHLKRRHLLIAPQSFEALALQKDAPRGVSRLMKPLKAFGYTVRRRGLLAA